jgi:hypothetical protein
VGTDRYATAGDVAQKFFTAPTTIGIASGATFPDALAGGAELATIGAPLLLTAPTGLPTPTSTYLTGVKQTATAAQVFGGTTSLSAATQQAIQQALGKQ